MALRPPSFSISPNTKPGSSVVADKSEPGVSVTANVVLPTGRQKSGSSSTTLDKAAKAYKEVMESIEYIKR